jgi:hypothetical protein
MLQPVFEDLGLVELVQASRHGRERSRRERRYSSDAGISLARLDGTILEGWALDRSAGGARMVLVGDEQLVPGELVSLAFADEPQFLARVAWARHEKEAVVLGVELVVMASGEARALDALDVEDAA